MNIGIFGGSFDPPHLEHVRLAAAAVESLNLDKLFVVPAHTPPHKKDKVLSSDEDRLEMCRIAFNDCPRTEVSDCEIRQGGTSYTYLTCRRFRELYPSAKLFWLVGTDMLRDFPTWRNPEEILSLAALAVCARAEKPGWTEKELKDFTARFKTDFAIIRYDGKDVSSTEVRVLAAAGENVISLVGAKTAEYIRKNRLYEIPHAREALLLEKPSRRAHSIRVALFAAEYAAKFGISEKQAVTAALFHDCAKNLPPDSPYLRGFRPPKGVPEPVLHQYSGAYVAEKFFEVTDGEVLDAMRYHTSGRADMTSLGKLVFLSDMLESGRQFDGVEKLRKIFREEGLDPCMRQALRDTLSYLEKSGGEIYPLTREAYEFLKREQA